MTPEEKEEHELLKTTFFMQLLNGKTPEVNPRLEELNDKAIREYKERIYGNKPSTEDGKEQ